MRGDERVTGKQETDPLPLDPVERCVWTQDLPNRLFQNFVPSVPYPFNRQPHILVRNYAHLLGRCPAGLEHADPTHADPAHANRRPHILVRNYAHLPGRCSVGLEDADPAHADPAHANPAHHAVKTA